MVPNIAKMIGKPEEMLTLSYMSHLWDGLVANHFARQKIPVPFGTPEWKALEASNDIYNSVWHFGSAELLKIGVGPMLQEIIYKIDLKLNGTIKEIKWFMFSAHDTNLAALLTAFGYMSWQCQLKKYQGEANDTCKGKPPYASEMLFEIYTDAEKQNEASIKLIYNGEELSLCGGPHLCPYKAWRDKIAREFFVTDVRTTCELPPRKMPKIIHSHLVDRGLIKFYYAIGVLFLLILVLTIVYIMLLNAGNRASAVPGKDQSASRIVEPAKQP
jgi:hypothetical protein